MPLPPRSRDAPHRLPSARAERDVRYREELTAGGTGAGRGTIGADKGYNQRAVVGGIREAGKTPHVAAKASGNAIDGRTTRHAGYAVSQRLRKRVEEIFGWMKTIGQAARRHPLEAHAHQEVLPRVTASFRWVESRPIPSAS